MSVPTTATYSAAAKIAAHTTFRDLVDSGSAAGAIKIRSSADVLLATIPLDDPCGTVNETTGQLTLSPDGRDESADATGTAAYAEICNSDGVVHLSMPVQAGSEAVSGYMVINTLSVISGATFEVLSAIVG